MEQKIYPDVTAMLKDVDLFRDQILWVEGCMKAGKSTLATAIANEMPSKCHVLHLDKFVEPKDAYFDCIQMDKLSAVIKNIPKPLIIEGVCLSKVREHLGIENGIVVYVRRMKPNGDWQDEDECVFASQDEVWVDAPLTAEVRQYHYDYQPHEKADYIFDRIETPL